MSEEQLKFLEMELPMARGEYLLQINANVPQLLSAYDRVALGGYSDERHVQLEKQDGYFKARLNPSLLRSEGDRSAYQELSSTLQGLKGEDREAFLYGLRRVLLIFQKQIPREEGKMRNIAQTVDLLIEQKNLPEALRTTDSETLEEALKLGLGVSYNQLQRLRGGSSVYRDVYRVMVDAVRQTLQEPELVTSSSGQ